LELADMVRHYASTVGEIRAEEYALNRDGQHAFGVLSVDMGVAYRALSIGWRNSHDKVIPVDIASGDHIFVCDNLSFHGDSYRAMKRHTPNVWPAVERIIVEAMRAAPDHFAVQEEEYAKMREHELTQRQGFQILGVALGKGVLKSQQATASYREWTKPSHEEFEARNAYSLYNCMTEGLKRGAANTALPRLTNAHHWFVEEMALA
jgi:hypothetical protein